MELLGYPARVTAGDDGRVLVGRYALGAAIGSGGMGVVHRGYDRVLERSVAIKLVGDAASRERFLSEARRTAQIRHPAVVEVFDVGTDGDDVFLVMELLEGESLETKLDREGRLAPAEAIAIGTRICDALGAAHALGVVHRDIKPANVFLTRSGDELLVKVLDFGIAKRLDGATARTDPGMLVGTITYMAPEHIRGEDVDGRADLYSLGVLLYRALSGRLPFQGESAAMLIHAHLSIAPQSVRSVEGAANVPPALDTTVLRLLSKSPEARPRDAADAKAALAAALAAKAPAVDSRPRLVPEMPRELDLDPSAEAISLELDDRRAPARAPAPIVVRAFAPPAVGSAGGALSHEASSPEPLPGLAVLASIPPSVSKRLAAYGAFGVFLDVVFFGARLAPLIGFGLLSCVGLIAYIATKRR